MKQSVEVGVAELEKESHTEGKDSLESLLKDDGYVTTKPVGLA